MSRFVLLGVLTRINRSGRKKIEQQLVASPGVSVFDVDDEQRLGVLIEGETMASAEACLREHVMQTEGVLAAWPVFMHDDWVESPEEEVETGFRKGCDDG